MGVDACCGCERDAAQLLDLLRSEARGSLKNELSGVVSHLSGREGRLRQPSAYERALQR